MENLNNREPVFIDGNNDITIEHIFPQNPDNKWKVELGNDEFNFIKDNYLNTIANLTLSGNNGKMGNKTFLEKSDLKDAGYKDSRLWLNKYLASINKWDKDEIEKRYQLIIERVLEIWSIPDIIIEEKPDNNEINIFDAEDPKHKKLDYPVFFDQKLEVTQVSRLYVEVFKRLFELQPETFFTSSIGGRIGLTKSIEDSNIRQPIKINDTYFIEGNLDNIGKFDRIKEALVVFDLEDELLIKYAED